MSPLLSLNPAKCTGSLKRLSRWLLILPFLGLLGACSAIQLLYNNAQTLMYIMVDGYFDFDQAQEAAARDKIAKVHAWHRSTQLTQYAQFLQRTQTVLFEANPPSKQQVAAISEQVLASYQAFVDRTVPDMAQMALMLNEKNLTALQKKQKTERDKFRKEWIDLSPQKLQEKRRENLVKRFDFWFGRPTKEQREQLHQMADAQPSYVQFWYEQRQQRDAQLIVMLRQIQQTKPSQAQVEEQVRSFMRSTQEGTDATTKQMINNGRQTAEAVTLQILQMANAEQRAKARNKLNEWANELTALASQTNQSPSTNRNVLGALPTTPVLDRITYATQGGE